MGVTDDVLTAYHALEPCPLETATFYTKAGVRGYPDLPPGLGETLRKTRFSADELTDVSGSAGFALLRALECGEVEGGVVLETSRAALRCALATFADDPAVSVAAGAPWDAPKGSAEHLVLAPTTDRGTARVLAELAGAHAALEPGGTAYLLMHKDSGGKRYEKEAARLFRGLEPLAKSSGWRLSRVVKRTSDAPAVEPVPFEAGGLRLEAFPGVFAAGKLDPGTALFLDAVDFSEVAGKRTLDLGCGYGVLALKASLAGAEVTALDDDLLAVRSTYSNAKTYGLDVRALHSDVDSELKDERFDAVLMNPPFHVGKGVRLGLPRAFLAAAHKYLVPGGTLTLVANKALPYERELGFWTRWETLATDARFKVLRAVK